MGCQHSCVEKLIKDDLFSMMMTPSWKVCEPNLKRVAVVSCQLWGPDPNGGFTVAVHEVLNKTLTAAIRAVLAAATEKNDWATYDAWTNQYVEWNIACDTENKIAEVRKY